MAVSFASAEEITPPTFTAETPSGGAFCDVCGDPIEWTPGHGRKPKYCTLHKTPASRNRTDAGGAVGGTGKKRTSKTNSKKATEDQWDGFLSMILLAGSYMVGRFAAGGTGLLLQAPIGMTTESLDEYSDMLAMSEDEAEPIAKLIAQRAAPSAFNKKYGYLVVNSLELEAVGAALFSYGKRIGPVLADRIKNSTPQLGNVRPPRRAKQQPGPTTNGNGVHANGQATGQNQPSYAEIVAEANERLRAGNYPGGTPSDN